MAVLTAAVLVFAAVACAAAGPAEIVLQRGSHIEVSSAVYSPNGFIVASAGDSDAIRLWERGSGDLVRSLPGHAERIVGLAFSPDGQFLASSSTDGMVKLWDYGHGRLAQRLTNHIGNWARRVAFSPDSRWLVAAAYQSPVSVWDVASGEVVRTLPTQGRTVDVLFTPDGRFVVTASRENSWIQFWDWATGAPALALNHSNSLHSISVSQDGRRFAAGGDHGVVNLWELPSGRWLRGLCLPDKGNVFDIDFSPDGTRLAAAGKWVNTLWATESGALLCEMRGHRDATFQISFSPDGRELASGSSDASVRLWDVPSGRLRRTFAARAPDAPITSIAFSPDGRLEAIGSIDAVVRVWDDHDGGFDYELRGHEGPIQALAFSQDSAWLFSGGADRVMRVWDMAHGNVSAYHPYFDRTDAIGAVAVGGGEGYVATASGPYASPSLNHLVTIWQPHYDRPIRELQGHTASVRSLAYAPGADLLASASTDGTVKLWNSKTARCLYTRTNAVQVEAVAFSADSRSLIIGLADGILQVMETNGLSVSREWRAHQSPVQTLAVSGHWLATASTDRTVALWNWETGQALHRFTNITSQYLPVAFHPTRAVLAFAQTDQMIVYTDVETSQVLLQRVLFPDGEWLAWNRDTACYVSSPHGHENARLRLPGQLHPVYPLALYRTELNRANHWQTVVAGPAPALAPKNFQLWWHRYPYKTAWLYGALAAALIWVAVRLRRGWIAERVRRAQEKFSRQLLMSQEAERKRIAGELHDSLGQNLLIIKNRLYLVQQQEQGLAQSTQLREISQTVSQTIEEVREISHNLRPYQLDRLGLTKAVRSVIKKVADSGALSIVSRLGNLDGVFAPEGEINFYRIVQESLSNILKHSNAATAQIIIKTHEGRLTMRIEDDGQGFDYRRTISDSPAEGGFGLTGLSERVRILGGRFTCDSTPGRGTRLTFEIPIRPKHEEGNQDSDGRRPSGLPRWFAADHPQRLQSDHPPGNR